MASVRQLAKDVNIIQVRRMCRCLPVDLLSQVVDFHDATWEMLDLLQLVDFYFDQSWLSLIAAFQSNSLGLRWWGRVASRTGETMKYGPARPVGQTQPRAWRACQIPKHCIVTLQSNLPLALVWLARFLAGRPHLLFTCSLRFGTPTTLTEVSHSAACAGYDQNQERSGSSVFM